MVGRVQLSTYARRVGKKKKEKIKKTPEKINDKKKKRKSNESSNSPAASETDVRQIYRVKRCKETREQFPR